MKRAALALGLSAAMFTSASAADGCRDIEYHDYAQPVIFCPAGMLCQIILDRDERVHRAFSSEAGQWEPNLAVEGKEGSFRSSLVLKPETDNLTANFMVFTSRRTYHFIVKSVQGDRVCVMRFLFDDERRAYDRAHPKPRPVHVASTKPLTPQQQLQRSIDAAVAYTDAYGDTYGMDPQPEDYRIVRVAHSADHTYIQLVALSTTPSTVPQLMDTENGSKVVEHTYDPTLRVYVIDNVSREYTLSIPDGKRTRSVRVQRQRIGVAIRGR